MDYNALVIEEIDAGKRFIDEFAKYAAVRAAFWLKASDDDFRYLYVACENIDDGNSDLLYSEVLRLTAVLQPAYLDPFRVKLIDADDPLARAAKEINTRFPGHLATRYGGKSFGGISVDEVYIYPTLSAVISP